MTPRLMLLVVAACGCGAAQATRGGPPPPPGALEIWRNEVVPPPTLCAATAPKPVLDPWFAPTLSGPVTLVSARGDARLLGTEDTLIAWSADGSVVALGDGRAVVLRRTSDAAPLDRIVCPGRDIGANERAMSPDLRWLAVSGLLTAGADRKPITCVVDRSSHTTRVIDGWIMAPRFEHDTLVGRDRSLDLATGAVTLHAPATPDWPAPPAPPIERFDTEGAVELAVSHDGRYLAGWRGTPIAIASLEGPPTPVAPAPPPFLAVWDRATGRRLWRGASYDRTWRFSPDDRFLEIVGGTPNTELVRVESGERLHFPGELLPLGPDSRHILMHGNRGLELWSTDPQHQIAPAPALREVLARSRDGTITASREAYRLVIERPGRCLAFEVGRDIHTVALSADGRELYVGFFGYATSMFALWRTDTGAVTSAITVTGPARVYPLPSIDQVGIEVASGLRIFDAHTRHEVAVARAPRVHRTHVGPGGDHSSQARDVRDHAGERVEPLAGRATAFADGRHLLVQQLLSDSALAIWDLRDPRRVQDLPLPASEPPQLIDLQRPPLTVDVALAPDERHVAAGTRDGGGILLWTREGTLIPVAAQHELQIVALAFSPDGRVLASSGEDGSVALTDTASGALIGTVTLAPDRDRVRELWWSPDSTQLMIASAREFEVTVAVHLPPREARR